jgi:hypothetical protein
MSNGPLSAKPKPSLHQSLLYLRASLQPKKDYAVASPFPFSAEKAFFCLLRRHFGKLDVSARFIVKSTIIDGRVAKRKPLNQKRPYD